MLIPSSRSTYLGIAGGGLVVACAVSNLWPLVSQPEGKQTMLHALTSWMLLPLGLLLALRDGHYAGLVQAHSVLGSHFRSAVDLVETEARFVIFLVWAGLTAFFGYGGLYGTLAGLMCIARALTLLPQVHALIEKGTALLQEKLEERSINIPGFTNPPAAAAHVKE